MKPHAALRLSLALLLLPLAAPGAGAQVAMRSYRPFAANVIVPQSRAFHLPVRRHGRRPMRNPVAITDVRVRVRIRDQVATTTMEIGLRNRSGRRQESELLVPVPEGVVVRGMSFQGAAAEPTAELLPLDRARGIYDGLVARVRDPMLLEFAGYQLLRSSVFPVEPRGRQRVQVVYEQILPAHGARVDYVLPRTESLSNRVPWRISVQIEAGLAVPAVYSPSHEIRLARPGPRRVEVRLAGGKTVTPGAFRLSYLLEQGELSATLFAYPEPARGGGSFLLLAGMPPDILKRAKSRGLRREITLVLDRSGSMRGEKMRQARQAAIQVIEELNAGEYFNILIYDSSVEAFARRPVRKTFAEMARARAWIKAIEARGGTNIHDALVEALRPEPTPGTLPLVLFLTDGLPTIGRTSERTIRKLVVGANRARRRVFTFGVGADVNTPLLRALSSRSRGAATFVLPGQNLRAKVLEVFRRLRGPVLSDISLRILGRDGRERPGRVADLLPTRLPDLFEGDQIVLLGRYIGEEPLRFEVEGDLLGKRRTLRFDLSVKHATTRNAFVPRLWASRKIAVLVDAIREHGAGAIWGRGAPPDLRDPRIRELVEEVVRLSEEFGVLTEYTAFLAREGSDLGRPEDRVARAGRKMVERAIRTRSGLASVNQSINMERQASQTVLNPRNAYWDRNMSRVEVANVRQAADRALYRRANRWVDSRLLQHPSARPDSVVVFGSPAFQKVLRRLVATGRQASIALPGEILIEVEGRTVLVRNPSAATGGRAN